MSYVSIICDILIVLISSFAIIQYLLNKCNLRKSAATLIYNQLKDFDNYVDKIKGLCNADGTINDYHLMTLNSVVEFNFWTQKKHLLIKYLSQDDIALIDKTYGVVENLDTARKRILDTFMTTNNAKSFALQFKSIDLIDLENENRHLMKIADEFCKLGTSFNFRIPYDVFSNMVINYERVVGTTTMEKLKKMSYKNKK